MNKPRHTAYALSFSGLMCRLIPEHSVTGVMMRISLLLVVMISGIATPPAISAQEPLSDRERQKVVDDVSAPWSDWETITISGKLKMAGLPLSPSVKIYMERDSLLRISLRAPLMGEVGRAEIYGDTLLVVNKMKKTFVKEPLDSVMRRYPVAVADVQSLLLGRVVIPGAGTLSAESASLVELFPEDDGQFSLIPGEEMTLAEFNYGYLINTDMLPAVLLVIPTENPDSSVSLTYEYTPGGYDIFASYQSPSKIYSGTLMLDSPQEGGSPIEPIRLSGKYSRLNFGQFMKSF